MNKSSYKVKYIRHNNSKFIGIQFFKSIEAANLFVEKIKSLEYISEAEIIQCDNDKNSL